MFITFEGFECSGKSTQIKKLNQYLNNCGYKTVLTKDPGGTESGKEIRRMLLHEKYSEVSRFLLYSADRSITIDQLITPNLNIKDTYILADRYYDSTMILQDIFSKDGFSFEKAYDLFENVLNFPVPDLTFFIYISKEEIKNRLQKREDNNPLDTEFYERHDYVHKKVMKINSMFERFILIDGMQGEDKILKDIVYEIEKFKFNKRLL